MTSNVFIKQEEIEDRITLSLLNKESTYKPTNILNNKYLGNPNYNIYSDISDQLQKAQTDLPRLFKY